MNYQHAFHAGNFADVHKHVVLTRILEHLRAKPAAFRVIDSHAGAGRYDLMGPEPSRSGEWRDGIKRIWEGVSQDAQRRDGALALLAPYLACVTALNRDGELRVYPGSPVIAQALLRPQDRLIACELEPRAAVLLKAALRGDRRSKVLTIDGWTALSATIPPKERRGLVLVDPPFEEGADFMRLSGALGDAHRKWPTGIYMLWYPIKQRDAPEALARRLRQLGVAKILRCELRLGPPPAGAAVVDLRPVGARSVGARFVGARPVGPKLAGSGLILVNPPYPLEAELRLVLPALARLLGPHAASRLDWLAQRE
jgi:23S rRNA (adenine2030-N6)-methyltransferase